MPSAKTSLDTIKSDVCDTTLVFMSWLTIPAIVISVSRAQDIGWTAQYNGQISGALVVWLMAFFRKKLPYHLRAGTILSLLFWMGFTGQIFTTAPTAYVFYTSACAMAAVFYGVWAGVAATVLSIVITLSTFFAIKAGLFPTPTYAAGMALTTWLSRLASLIVAAAGPVIAVSQLQKTLTRELERAEATSDAKSNFLATMSHELRTPMTAIIGTAELLAEDPLSPDQERKVGRIARAGKSLLSLLNDLLDFAKIEAEQMSIDRVPFRVADVLSEVRELFSPLASEKGLTLSVEGLHGAEILYGDPARLRQVLSNLVANAVKFTAIGAIAISATQEEIAPGRVMLRVKVADTGMGISEADQARLFQPFVQAQDFRSRTQGGTGLGLTISGRLAALMGGEIDLVSVPGKGSTFTLTLPLDVAADAPAPRAETRPTAVTASVPLRLLLAEDNESIRDLMTEMLTRRGHSVTVVENGREALEAVRAKEFDVLVLDMHMPVMDGAEATRAVRALGTSAAAVPIVALTAGLTEDQRRAYLAAGVNQVVAKPAHWPTLFEAIESRGLAHREASGASANPVAAPATGSLDESLISDLEAALGAEAMRSALVTFRSGVEGYFAEVNAALAAGDASAARRIGHAIKGTCLQFGASEVARLGAAIEAKTASLEEMKRAAAQFAPAFARFTAALEKRAA